MIYKNFFAESLRALKMYQQYMILDLQACSSMTTLKAQLHITFPTTR